MQEPVRLSECGLRRGDRCQDAAVKVNDGDARAHHARVRLGAEIRARGDNVRLRRHRIGDEASDRERQGACGLHKERAEGDPPGGHGLVRGDHDEALGVVGGHFLDHREELREVLNCPCVCSNHVAQRLGLVLGGDRERRRPPVDPLTGGLLEAPVERAEQLRGSHHPEVVRIGCRNRLGQEISRAAVVGDTRGNTARQIVSARMPAVREGGRVIQRIVVSVPSHDNAVKQRVTDDLTVLGVHPLRDCLEVEAVDPVNGFAGPRVGVERDVEHCVTPASAGSRAAPSARAEARPPCGA